MADKADAARVASADRESWPRQWIGRGGLASVDDTQLQLRLLRDRALICGDVFFNLHPVTLRVGLREPPAVLTADPERNRRSAQRLAELEPTLVLFGHGPPLRDTERFMRFAASLSA